MSFVDGYLPFFRQWLITRLLSAVYFSRLCLLLQCAQSTPPLLLHVFFSSLFIIQFFFMRQGSVCPGAMLVYPRGSCGNTTWCLFAHLLVCVSRARLELASGGAGALLFSQCNMAWISFVWAGGFFSAMCGSSVSASFLIYGAHKFCFFPLVAILDPRIPSIPF
jgi:hypothetical protein